MSPPSEEELSESDLVSENSLAVSTCGVFGRLGGGLELSGLSGSDLRECFSSVRLSLQFRWGAGSETPRHATTGAYLSLRSWGVFVLESEVPGRRVVELLPSEGIELDELDELVVDGDDQQVEVRDFASHRFFRRDL